MKFGMVYRSGHRARWMDDTAAEASADFAAHPDYEQWSPAPRCAQCGQKFRPVIRRVQMYCSRECSRKAAHARRSARLLWAREDRTCPICGTTFTPPRADAAYCSPKCRQKAYRQRVTDGRSGAGSGTSTRNVTDGCSRAGAGYPTRNAPKPVRRPTAVLCPQCGRPIVEQAETSTHTVYIHEWVDVGGPASIPDACTVPRGGAR